MQRCLTLMSLSLVLILTACGRGGPDVGDASASEFRSVRVLDWSTTVPDPEAEWNPDSYTIVARSVQGLMVVTEGLGGSRFFASPDGITAKDDRAIHEPQWLTDGAVIFGGNPTLSREDDGRILLPGLGLKVASFNRSGISQVRDFAEHAYRPRIWGHKIVACIENRIIVYDKQGKHEIFAEGFLPEPQRDGDGIMWQETPVFTPDWWTGTEGVGSLVIRWEPGKVDLIERAVEARWTAAGGVVATVIRGQPGEAPWFTPGTDVVHISGPGAKPEVILPGGRNPEPHPLHRVVAASNERGELVLFDLDGSDVRVIAERGRRLRWSYDGRRLLAQEPEPERDACTLRIHVFTIGDPVTAAGE